MATDSALRVTFPQRDITVNTAIVRAEAVAPDALAVMTESTPFHPLDFIWPDQPADRGTLSIGDQTLDVSDCLTGAIDVESGKLHIDQEIPVRKGEEGWQFVAVHILKSVNHLQLFQPGAEITLTVDAHYQQQLSLGHTACHLSAMALNRAASPFWRKQPSRRDVLDSPDFDQMAIFSSQILAGGSRDHYRLGKSICKKGLRSDEFMQDLPQLMAATEQQVNNWLALGSPITIQCEGKTLTDRRFWHCDLGEDGQAIIPCGGSHARSLKELGAVRVKAEPVSELEFVMVTDVIGLQ